MNFMSNVAVTLACLGLLLPQSVLAQQTTAAKKSAKPPVRDLVLAQGGIVRGQVVDAQNVPVASTLVAVVANGKKIRETTTDRNGRFVVSGLQSGCLCRRQCGWIWAVSHMVRGCRTAFDSNRRVDRRRRNRRAWPEPAALLVDRPLGDQSRNCCSHRDSDCGQQQQEVRQLAVPSFAAGARPSLRTDRTTIHRVVCLTRV